MEEEGVSSAFESYSYFIEPEPEPGEEKFNLCKLVLMRMKHEFITNIYE